MSHGKTKSFSQTQSINYAQSDEYEVVSTHDLILMSAKTIDSTVGENKGIDLNEKTLFSNVLSYEEEWGEFFKKGELDIEFLKKKSSQGILKTSHFRSVYWRVLLGVLHKQPMQWLCQLQTYRKHYSDVLEELDHNPWNKVIPSDNPLSQETESVWQKYFCDEELKAVILQDVKRTFPDIEYFRKEEVQNIMVRVLFCYARQNPILCYRQGMHEILAPLMLVLCSDHNAFLLALKENPQLEKNILNVLSPEYFEHDVYSLFKNVMSHIQYSYRINIMKEELKTDENEIIPRLDFIKKNILLQRDAELCSHLEKLDIPLHLFGIRWLRLLFGREFQLQDLLVLWDFIFATNFECVNYIVVAMLIAIREILLKGDYNTCLSILMKYPNGINVDWVIAYAQNLWNPNEHSLPFHLNQFKTSSNLNSRQPKTTHQPYEPRRLKRGSSKSKNSIFTSNECLLGLEQSGHGDNLLMQGFVIHDSNFPKDELQQIKMVLSLVHHKLLHFHSLLQASLQGTSNPDVKYVINGLSEISSYLKNYDTCEIETACEAGESKEKDFSAKHFGSKESKDINSPVNSVNADRKSHTLPKTKKSFRSGELKTFKKHTGGNIVGAPMTDPLHLIKNSELVGES